MQLHLVRHAIAADRSAGEPDDSRPLTREGKRRFRRGAQGLATLDVRYDLVVHSPLLRAVETAELMADLAEELRVDDQLARPPARALFTWLCELRNRDAERIALVGHQPWLSELGAWLCTGSTDPASAMPLKKGGVLWLEGEPTPGGMDLRAALPPAVLRALA